MEEKEPIKIKLSTVILLIILLIVLIFPTFLILPNNNENQVNNEELVDNIVENDKVNKEDIEKYLGKIYFILEDVIPSFTDINEANEKWIWKCAYCNLVRNEKDTGDKVTKEQVEDSAKEIFGKDFIKQFPKEGLEFWLEPDGNKYFVAAAGIEPDYFYEYIINSIAYKDNQVLLELIEYKTSDIWHNQTELKVLNIATNEEIKKYDLIEYDNNDYLLEMQENVKEFIKNNKEKFSMAKITLQIDEEFNQLYVVSVQR